MELKWSDMCIYLKNTDTGAVDTLQNWQKILKDFWKSGVIPNKNHLTSDQYIALKLKQCFKSVEKNV